MRNEVEKKTKIGEEIESIINAGNLISDKIIIKIVNNKITEKLGVYKGFLFDGFPRNLDQAKTFNDLLYENNQDLTAVIQLHVDEEETIKRIEKRKLEEKYPINDGDSLLMEAVLFAQSKGVEDQPRGRGKRTVGERGERRRCRETSPGIWKEDLGGRNRSESPGPKVATTPF